MQIARMCTPAMYVCAEVCTGGISATADPRDFLKTSRDASVSGGARRDVRCSAISH